MFSMRIAIATVALAAALGLAACGGDGGSSGATGTAPASGSPGGAQAGKVRDVGLVAAYCLYGSDTKGQMLACEAKTTPAQVRSADDEAARWARGELQECSKSAGELCRYYRETPESQTAGETP